jgi:hypothetical protein
MEAILGISLYNYPHLNQQKHFVFLIFSYVYSSTTLEKRFCLEVGGLGGRNRGQGGQGEEMSPTIYAHRYTDFKY